jgi:hypothetical protein
MSIYCLRPLLFWAVRDLRRRPLESCLLTAALLATVALTATPLLFTQAATTTWLKFLDGTPSMVVREFDAMGWVPIPAEESVNIAKNVTGVTAARARVWGSVAGPSGLLTVIGINPDRPPPWAAVLPGKGEVVVNADIARDRTMPDLTVTGRKTATLRVIGRFHAPTDLPVNNAVLIHIDNARALLGIPSGYASDLAIDVFNPIEEAAILPEMAAAFPRPVRITTRTETAGIRAAGLARRGGMAIATFVPALLALCLLVMVTVRERLGRRFEIGLLKALGWTTGDIVSLQVLRAVSISFTAITGGMLVAFILVYPHGTHWLGLFFPEWQSLPSRLIFNPLDLALPLFEATGLVVLPFLAATIAAALRAAVSDPGDMLERTNF